MKGNKENFNPQDNYKPIPSKAMLVIDRAVRGLKDDPEKQKVWSLFQLKKLHEIKVIYERFKAHESNSEGEKRALLELSEAETLAKLAIDENQMLGSKLRQLDEAYEEVYRLVSSGDNLPDIVLMMRISSAIVMRI